MNITVIPQSPPIKVRVTVREKTGDTWHEENRYVGYIVAWQVQPDDGLADMIPVVWSSGDGQAFAMGVGKDTRYLLDEIQGDA